MSDHLDQLDYYTLLGVTAQASTDEIRAAFRKFALKFHPDRHVEGGEEKVARATTIYRRGSEALETLIDPTRRKAYDIVLAKGEMRLTVDAQTVTRGQTSSVKSSRTGTKRSGTGQSRPPGTKRRSVAPAAGGRRSAAPPAAKPAPREIQSPTAKAFYARALEASRARDYKTALRMIESALSQEPGHPLLLEAQKRLRPYVD